LMFEEIQEALEFIEKELRKEEKEKK